MVTKVFVFLWIIMKQTYALHLVVGDMPSGESRGGIYKPLKG
jgi:hypothetical protein